MPANTVDERMSPFQPRDRNIRVWRYMDLPKLIDFLETAGLHFPRADTLGDPYEGFFTRGDVADREKRYEAIGIKLPTDRARQMARSLTDYSREATYISCWHGGETESAAMWRLYGSAGGSVAIQTTYGKLADALPDEAYMGMVRYISYGLENWIDQSFVISPFMYKRREFEHEKEVRALIARRRKEARGKTGTQGRHRHRQGN